MVDFMVSTILLLTLMPLVFVIFLTALVMFHGSPFFVQRRPGKNGRIFTLLKFRSMKKGDGNDEDRITPFGRFLRRTSLDEIPQLWNVIIGHMSLVGPRPLLVEYLPLYSEKEARRHDVRPGITGWAQVNGRNALSWPEKFDLDIWYVEHISFSLDCRIILRTIQKVVSPQHTESEILNIPGKFTGKGKN